MLLVHPLTKSRHPLLRVVSMLLGLALLGLLLLFGLVAAGVLLVGGGVLLAWRQWKKLRAQPAAAARAGSSRPPVLEGEFVILSSERRNTR
jgi:threonine/homoserine/homoserine lactone efflux protein